MCPGFKTNSLMKLHSGRVDCILGGCGAFWAGAFFESIYIHREFIEINACKGEHSSQGFVYYTIEFWEGARWSGRICIRPKHIKHHSGRECVAFWSLFSVALVFSLRPSSYLSPWWFTPSNLQLSKTIRMVPIRNLHGCKGEYSSQGFVQPLNPGLNPCPWY